MYDSLIMCIGEIHFSQCNFNRKSSNWKRTTLIVTWKILQIIGEKPRERDVQYVNTVCLYLELISF